MNEEQRVPVNKLVQKLFSFLKERLPSEHLQQQVIDYFEKNVFGKNEKDLSYSRITIELGDTSEIAEAIQQFTVILSSEANQDRLVNLPKPSTVETGSLEAYDWPRDIKSLNNLSDSLAGPKAIEADESVQFFHYQKIESMMLKPNQIHPKILEDLETGFIAYMDKMIQDLITISKEAQNNDEHNAHTFYKMVDKDPTVEETKNNVVTVNDALADYKFAERRELEIEKFYEDKIQNNREKEAKAEEMKAAMGTEDKKKKSQFNEVNLWGPRDIEDIIQNETGEGKGRSKREQIQRGSKPRNSALHRHEKRQASRGLYAGKAHSYGVVG